MKFFPLLLLLMLVRSTVAEVSGSVLNVIRKRGYMVVGLARDYPPFTNHDGSAGFEPRLARELADHLGTRVEFVLLDTRDRIPAMQNGQVDFLIAAMTPTRNRLRHVWFSEPYIMAQAGMLIRTDVLPRTSLGEQFETIPVSRIEDLHPAGVRVAVAVKSESYYNDFVQTRLPDMQRVEIITNEEGIALLMSGQVQALVQDTLYLRNRMQTIPELRSQMLLLPSRGPDVPLCIGLPWGDTKAKSVIDQFVREIVREGLIPVWLATADP